MLRKLLLLLLLVMPTAVQAAWKEATSAHFIAYGEGSEEKLRETVAELEKFNFLLHAVSGIKQRETPVKLKLYLVEGTEGVQGTLPAGSAEGIAGYYNASSRGPFAVMPMEKSGWGSATVDARSTLFHEYTHHFMLSNFPATYPTWFTEGFAEYYGETKVDGNAFEVGRPAKDRYETLRRDQWLPVGKMLRAKNYSDVGSSILQLYAEGWLLVHYLSANQERAQKLHAFLDAVNRGKDFAAARDEIFGPDARKLDAELYAYSRKRRLDTLRIAFPSIDFGTISVRPLSAAEESLLPYEIVLMRGLLVREANGFADAVRKLTRRLPESPRSFEVLAQAEMAAGNSDAAKAAVESWLAIQPGAPRALTYNAMLQMRALKAAKSTDVAAWKAVRQMLIRAITAAKDDPMILEAYYDSFTAQGGLPPIGAQNGLYRAFELVPQANELRYKVALDFEKRDMIQDAIDVIKPAAFGLHSKDNESEGEKRRRERLEEKWREVGTEKRETAREMLARLEKKLAEKSGGKAAAQMEQKPAIAS